ncbi:hypothetical protein OUZ56_033187 [Daphnia magna]|uniref:Uncharacterized protein n=1 Tax=Daphnia magna TaxID=35525 RepID=A0ABQ9ZXP1_9CRUS|nr:hypothetical protein OUZ56_033187 [Daphnia magna]
MDDVVERQISRNSHSKFISQRERANLMNSVYPRFKTLLKDPTNFSPSEEAQLFGPTFTSALLQAADEDAKLQKVASVGRISGGFSQRHNRNKRINQRIHAPRLRDRETRPRDVVTRQGILTVFLFSGCYDANLWWNGVSISKKEYRS